VLRQILEDDGYDIRTATDGGTAVTVYGESRPDAVLLDISMPQLDGLAVLYALRRMDPSARVAILSGDSKKSVIREAIQSGAQDFILKPFDVSQVLSTVEDLVAAA